MMFDRFKKAIFKIIPPSRRFMDRKFRESDASLIQNLENNNCLVNNVYNMSKEQLDHINIKVDEEYEILKNIYFDRIRENKDINILRDELLGLYNLADQKLDGILPKIHQNLCNNEIFWQKNTELIRAFQEKNSELINGFQEKNSELIRGFQGKNSELIRAFQEKNSESISSIQEKNSELIRAFQEKNDKLIDNIQKTINCLIDNQKKISNIMQENLFYTHRFEKSILKKSFLEINNDLYMKDKLEKLLLGLDTKSIDIVVLIINRVKIILDSDDNLMIDLYTEKEKNQLKTLKEEFNDKILKISENKYFYKGFYLPINLFEDSVIFYKHGIEEIKTLENVKNKDIIDVGGFIGDSILIFSPLTCKKVYSFEAVTENVEKMILTLKMNHIENAVVENLALGSQIKKCQINVAGSASTIDNCMGVKVEKQQEVYMTTLDDYVKRNNLNVGLIKVDIEGAEQDFLQGARKTIVQYKPILLISIYHSLDDFLSIKPIIESWNLGYKFKIYRPTIKKVVAETLLIGEIN